MYILGYLQRDSRVYLTDKDLAATSFALSLPVLEYQTLVLRGDMDTAAEVLHTVPQDQLNKIARFLEGQGHKDLALEVATDPEHRFDLALALNHLETARELAESSGADHKWKTLGDAGLVAWDVPLASESFEKSKDLGSLLLIYSSTSNRKGLAELAELAVASGAHNIAFSSKWLLGDVPGCLEILKNTGRLAEAVLFSQTYQPSLTAGLVGEWKSSLEKAKKGRVAKAIGMPGEDEELFPEWDEYLRLEKEGVAVDVDESSSPEEAEANSEEAEAADEDEEEE